MPEISHESMMKRTTLFRDLSPEALSHVAGYVIPKRYDAGAVITEEGGLTTGLCAIVSGSVSVIHNRGRPDEQELAVLKAGDFFGEMSLLLDQPRIATIVTREPTECVELRRWSFHDRAMENPEILWAMLVALAKRLHEADQFIFSAH